MLSKTGIRIESICGNADSLKQFLALIFEITALVFLFTVGATSVFSNDEPDPPATGNDSPPSAPATVL